MNKREHYKNIQQYYIESAQAYFHWGKDEEREGIYALHCGFEKPNEQISHYDSVKALTRELVSYADIADQQVVLDAGCGTGSIAYEVKEMFPYSQVYGINIALNQLQQANSYQLTVLKNEQVHFSLQDFENTAFRAEMFDSVIFSESIAHAITKKEVLTEVFRLLKPDGSVTIADVFLLRRPENGKELDSYNDALRGWFIPDMMLIDEFFTVLQESGFALEKSTDVSQYILPSALRMRTNSERRLAEQASFSPIIEMSRKAVVAAHETVQSGLVGYFFIKAKKA